MMRILQICQKPPWPPVDGGCLAMNAFNNWLRAQGHEVHVAAISSDKHPFDPTSLPVGTADSYLDLNIGPTFRFLPLLISLLSGSGYVLNRFYNNKTLDKLTNKIHEGWDIILIDGLYAAGALETIKSHSSTPVLMRTHNVEYSIWHQRALRSRGFKRLVFKRMAAILRRYEMAALSACDAVAAVSDEDAEQLTQLCRKNIHRIAIPVEAAKPAVGQEKVNDVVFLGAMDWAPNREALQWLIEKVWPLVGREIPGARLHIAGREMDAFAAMFRQPGIINHGTVTDAREFIRTYAIMAVPLFTGSGIRVKILESFAESCAVVSTAAGCRGMDVRNGTHLLIAETAADFANRLIGLLRNRQQALELAANALGWLKANMGAEAISASFAEILKDLGL